MPRPPQQGGSTDAYKWRQACTILHHLAPDVSETAFTKRLDFAELQDTEEVEVSVHVPGDAAKTDIKVHSCTS